ncbi:hypothetical protein [Sphingomonas lenta]|uniref:Uncharacterized protein n=1 Tax=Sphingomonas lenta TaxID=1141887 RepID=A0A2A2SCJ8_9SPHN|nr:hypothetical protein [Sphingomonas lenta]PAX06986.1 hypothetical protein CKY28_13050 [Sphingomonas lenta]
MSAAQNHAALGHAAQSRATLAAIGRDVLAGGGDPGERRAAALLDRLAGRAPPAATLGDLLETPGWMRRPRAEQRRIAVAAALLSMGPALATSIDGGWLRRLADAAGEELLDWAMERAGDLPALSGALGPDELEGRGFALLRALTPPSLRPHLGWAPGGSGSDAEAGGAEALVAAALEAPGAS